MRGMEKIVIQGIDITKEFLEEIASGDKMAAVRAKAQAMAAGKLNAMQNRTMNELCGELIGRIPVESYHYWGRRLGYECWRDNTFLREYFRDNPETKVNAKSERSMIMKTADFPSAGGMRIRTARGRWSR